MSQVRIALLFPEVDMEEYDIKPWHCMAIVERYNVHMILSGGYRIDYSILEEDDPNNRPFKHHKIMTGSRYRLLRWPSDFQS
ncbi:MAG TPA: hypothetical protein VEX17_04010 [Bacillales bacterium]|nr:hypothetical protein [Bacillales bacterium]